MYGETVSGRPDQGVILADLYFYAIDARLDGLVVTPRCDVEQQKADFLTVCAVKDAESTVRSLLAGGWSKMLDPEGQLMDSPGRNKMSDLRANLVRLMRQEIPRFQWLPPYAPRPSSLADFQLVQSFQHDELQGIDRLAQLGSPYAEQVLARYVAYMGRVGVNDPSEAELTALVEQLVSAIFPSL